MVTILFAVVSIFVFRFRSSAVLELKLVALQHQLAVLRRQRPGRPQLSSLDRLLWVLLYRIWPQIIDAMVLVKPATVVEWHRKGFRFYWRWRSRRPGRPRTSPEIRSDPPHEQRQPVVGCAAHSRGAAQTRHQNQPGHGRAVDAEAAQGPLPDLAGLPAQPSSRHCGD